MAYHFDVASGSAIVMLWCGHTVLWRIPLKQKKLTSKLNAT